MNRRQLTDLERILGGQENCAEAVDVARETWNRWVQGRNEPRGKNLKAVERLYAERAPGYIQPWQWRCADLLERTGHFTAVGASRFALRIEHRHILQAILEAYIADTEQSLDRVERVRRRGKDVRDEIVKQTASDLREAKEYLDRIVETTEPDPQARATERERKAKGDGPIDTPEDRERAIDLFEKARAEGDEIAKRKGIKPK